MVQLWGDSFHVLMCLVFLSLPSVCTHPPRSSVYISCLAAFAVKLLAMMGFFQDTGGSVGGGLFQYQRLELRDGEGAAPSRSRWRWMPAMAALNGKAAASCSPCLFHVKKLKWGSITSALMIPTKVAELSAKIRRAGAATEAADVCPAVIFMSPWGLPVLSRPLLGVGGHRSRYHHGRDVF